MCIVGIILVDFIKILIKSIIKHHTGVNLVKITKLGREIIEISIISTVQTHKLLILQGINQNFDLFPQKSVFRQVLTPIWGTIGEISPISTKFTYFYNHSHYIIQWLYAILVGQNTCY